jgi:hypothetical protein
MRHWKRWAITLAVLAVLASVHTVTAPPALAVEYDCRGWSTLSAFGDGQLFQARSCTEKAGSGPNAGRIRGHTKVQCVHPDRCELIDSETVEIRLRHWDPNQSIWRTAAFNGYFHVTFDDHSEDYYTPWVCHANYPGVDKWYTETLDLRARSWTGVPGSYHNHVSYQAELNPC